MPRPPVRPSSGESLVDAEIASLLTRADEIGRAYANMPALSAFQRRMERYGTFSPEAQNELAADYQKGRETQTTLNKRHGKTENIPARTMRKHRQTISRGEWAGEQLVGSNFRLLRLICRENAEERFGKEKANAMLPDLIAEANVALIEAAGKFDPDRGPSFPTYAARTVRDRIRMMVSKDGPIRLAPSWIRIKRIAAVRAPALETELGRPVALEELRQDLLKVCLEWAEQKLTPEQRQEPAETRQELMMAKLRKQGMLGAINNLEDVLIATQSVTSLDAPAGIDGTTTRSEQLADTNDDSMFENVELEELRGHLMTALGNLPDRERDILLRRYGFHDGEIWTFAKIAEQHGVTAERIRQIERNALTKLDGNRSLETYLTAS